MLGDNYDFHLMDDFPTTSPTNKSIACENFNLIFIMIGVLTLTFQIALLINYQKQRDFLILYFSLIDIVIIALGIAYFIIFKRRLETQRLDDILKHKKYIQTSKSHYIIYCLGQLDYLIWETLHL